MTHPSVLTGGGATVIHVEIAVVAMETGETIADVSEGARGAGGCGLS